MPQQQFSSLKAYENLYKGIKITDAIKRNAKQELQPIAEDTITHEAESSLQVCKFHDPLVMLNDPSFLERASPIVDKFYILTREDDSVSATQLKPNQQEQQLLDMLTDIPVF